ncbi:ATP-binding protein [Desulfobacterales bacterium HSG16]|nr:ATP-binding protein [Desulfobacterales bacterium HSG16]
MSIQKKIILSILPPILISLVVLGYWSVQVVIRGIENAAIEHMALTLDAYANDKVRDLYDVLVLNRLDKEIAFIKTYQAAAVQAAEKIKIVDSGAIFGLDENGKIVFSRNQNGQHTYKTLWKEIARDMINQGKMKRSGHAHIDIHGEKNGQIFAASHFKPWKWTIFYTASDKDLHKEQRSIRDATLLLAILCTATTILIVFLIFRAFIIRPIKKLHDAASAITRGEPIKQINISSRDELGILSRNMESMSRAIQEHSTEQKIWQKRLERKVKEQTAHLRKEIAERKQAEKDRTLLEMKLRQKQKLESVGTLAGGVAHEINNPINGIMNYAQLIKDRLNPDDPLLEFAEEIIYETNRVATIVRNLLAFARCEKESHSAAKISDILESTLSLIRTLIRHDQIILETDVSNDLPAIKCMNRQIQQVFMNLVTNARDALNERYPVYDENKIISLSAYLFEKKGKEWIRTTVEDHGIGIAPEARERMFDPFFTTKPRDKGTGLGLSISYGIVREHGGELHVESVQSNYTRFHMDLPVGIE